MFRITFLALLSIAAVGCSKKNEPSTSSTTTAAGSSATPTETGSATPTETGSATPTETGSATPTETGSATPTETGSAAPTETGSAAAGSAAPTDSVAAFDFDKLSHDEKMKFMKTKVVPTMKPLFQEFDKAKYANFGCKTCHGKNPQKVKYKMPSADLPALDFAAIKAGKQKPKVAEFMGKTVKPQMAKLLEQPEMTETHDGFGCLECHNQKK